MTSEYSRAQKRYHQQKFQLNKLLKNGGTARQVAHAQEKLKQLQTEYAQLRSQRIWDSLNDNPD